VKRIGRKEAQKAQNIRHFCAPCAFLRLSICIPSCGLISNELNELNELTDQSLA
jgi:hypothetical protein